MTRFVQEITGELGEWWMKHAMAEVDEKVKHANEEAIVDEDGAIKWKLSGNYLMDDYCEILEYAQYPFSRQVTAQKREEQNNEFIAAYKKEMEHHVYSDEELFEMRCAFGEGATIVDVVTGREITL